ncbi:MAG: protein-glutamate O-methyltransferase family protein [Ardenticatenaceae bacterium]|nr:protein-glutamate O-methyltransferase family protein [Ardenticatenaceae bacterium]
MNAPKLPVPQPLRGMDTQFTNHTVQNRLPGILMRILAENELPETAVSQLFILLDEIAEGEIQSLPDHLAPDLAAWEAAIEPHLGKTFLEVPWFFAETYFYRSIVAALDYFRSGIDPYAQQKQTGLDTTQTATSALFAQLNQTIGQGWQADNFGQLLLTALWGNQADMSMWAAGDAAMPSHAGSAAQLAHLLVNDGTAVTHLLSKPVNQIDFIIDNAGFELIGDLCLADYLLSVNQAATVQFHLKLHPTFVSDATVLDVESTVGYLRQQREAAVQIAGERLTNYLVNGRLRLLNHPFWTSPHPLWQMPPDLHQKLAASNLIISKGDANYRRALGDAPWPHTTPIQDIVSYLPTPTLFLRTCKSEVLAGVAHSRLQELDLEEDWLVNGRWGIIQLV